MPDVASVEHVAKLQSVYGTDLIIAGVVILLGIIFGGVYLKQTSDERRKMFNILVGNGNGNKGWVVEVLEEIGAIRESLGAFRAEAQAQSTEVTELSVAVEDLRGQVEAVRADQITSGEETKKSLTVGEELFTALNTAIEGIKEQIAGIPDLCDQLKRIQGEHDARVCRIEG